MTTKSEWTRSDTQKLCFANFNRKASQKLWQLKYVLSNFPFISFFSLFIHLKVQQKAELDEIERKMNGTARRRSSLRNLCHGVIKNWWVYPRAHHRHRQFVTTLWRRSAVNWTEKSPKETLRGKIIFGFLLSESRKFCVCACRRRHKQKAEKKQPTEEAKKSDFMNEIKRQAEHRPSFCQVSGVFGSTLIDISCRIVDPI